MWIAIQVPFVQNWIIKKVAANLSQKLHTRVSIKHVDFSLFNRMELEGLLIEDHQKDTLLYAGMAKLRITDWFFLKDKATLKYIFLQNTRVNMNRTDSVWNYQFLVDYFSGPKKDSTSKPGLQLDLKVIELENLRFNKVDKWLGKDIQLSLRKLDLNADNFDFTKKQVFIKQLNLDDPEFYQSTYTGNRINTGSSTTLVQQIIAQPALQWNAAGWDIDIKELNLNNARIAIDKETWGREPYSDRFDGQHLQFMGITGNLKNIRFLKDTMTTDLVLSATEKSGLEIKKIQARVKFTPELMEFSDLLMQTNRSLIGNYFAMHYTGFNTDFGNFLHNVTLEGNFENSHINSNDLAIFAPALKSWNREFEIQGTAKGPVDNLTAKRMIIKSGNTNIDGDIALRGLPDINNTFIDLKSNDFRTNYTDLVTLVPALRNVKQIQLNKLGNIRFKGNFTGFINDFVAFGNIGTNLGNINADINMKLPANRAATYSGKISSTGFQLGQFVNSSKIGNLAVDGKINGSGLNLNDLDANFDGKIHQFEFFGYGYREMSINGNFKKKLFRGHLDINDPNLKISDLDGTINLSDKQTQFNFDAVLHLANLKQLKLTNEDFSLSGHFNFDFTGNNIDNFLGKAKVYEASLRHDSTRLSFDSLYFASLIEGGNKVLTVSSNEIDGTITGQFKILELPDAFRVLLNRYYPSYIPKPVYTVSDQDFSFLIKTRIVDDFVQLADKKLKGFNNSTFSGNLKLAKNELNITAMVPEFSYDGKIFQDVTMISNGNAERLLDTITINDIIINDSFHLPNSKLYINAANDVSNMQLYTTASKTLTDAKLNASIQTLNDGVIINFFSSSFFLNEKKWNLEKDGILTIRKSTIEASSITFKQGEQKIIISTVPGESSNTTNVIAKLKKVNINDFTPLFLQKSRLEGILTGTLTLKNPFGKQVMEFDGVANEFRWEDKPIGDVNLSGDVNTSTGRIHFDAKANGKDNKFSIAGHYNYKDSTEDQLDLDFMSEHFNINLLETYLGNIFSNVVGDAVSTLKVKGGNHKYITGSVTVAGGSFKVNYTQCRYKFSNETILFNPDEIDLGTIQLKDTLNNPGTASGKMYHNFFKDFSFDDVQFETNRMLVLNTTKKDNSQFYGKVIGTALMTLNGPVSNLKMNIDGRPSPFETDSSHIYLPTGSSREAGQIDYIEFIQFGSKMDEGLNTREGTNILVNMNLTATPACKIDVILDEELGDIIKGRGNGLLNIRVGSKEPLSIRGRYDITDGEYTFNFQTFLKKYFTIKRGSIVWNGDPYLAKINIDADYLAKNVDVSSLASSKGFKQKENVTIISRLSGNLQKPDINFEFELPPNSEIAQDYVTKKKLEDFKNDANEMNKQVASLLLFNTFLNSNQNFLSGGSTFSLAANTIGGIVSNVLTNLFNKQLEKATNGVLTTYFDINSSLDLQNKAALLQASVKAGLKILLSSRLVVLIGGNLDYNNPYAQLAKKGLFTPDISVEWLLNKDGALRVVGFNRTSIDLTIGQRNRSGISLSYRKDFNRLSDIFTKKKTKTGAPKKPEDTNEVPIKVRMVPSGKN